MINRLLFSFLLTLFWFSTSFAVTTVFERGNTFYTPIPAVPTIATDSIKYVNAIIHADNGGTHFAVGSTEYAVPVWQASAGTANINVLIDAQDYVYLNTTSHRTEAQTVGGTEFTLMDDTGDYVYVGDVVFKNAVYFKLHTLGANYTLSVDYMKAGGAWQAVSNLVDSTTGLSAAACSAAVGNSAWTCKLSFNEPSDEATGTVNGIGGRYWLRIKTTSTPTTVAKAYFIQFADYDGEATLRQWNVVPIPTGAKGAGQDERQCPYLPTYGSEFDGQLVILSADGKWAWEFYQAYTCPAFEGGAWHANTVRKRARTIAASLEEYGVGNGSGISTVTDLGGGNYTQYDELGTIIACSAVALPHHMITREDYNAAIAGGSDGTFGHALFFKYSGETPTTPHYGHYPCLKTNTVGTKSNIDANTYYMSFGRRIQIKSGYNCTTNIPITDTGYLMKRAICETGKKYGFIFADIGGGAAKATELESSYGRTGTASPWYNVVLPQSAALPTNVWSTSNLQVIEPFCDNSEVCPGCTTPTVCTDDVTYLQPPTSPSAADVTPDNGGVIRLSWTVSASAGVTKQRIYRGTATGVYSETPIQTIGNNTTATYDDAGLTNGTTYYYILRAYNGTHLSAYSTEVSAVPSSQEAPVTPNSRDKVTRGKVTRSKVTRGVVTRP